MAWIHCGLDQCGLGHCGKLLIVVWIKSDWPTARGPSRQHRAVAALLARVKNYYIPHPYGLDSLWFGSSMAWLVLQVCSVGICSMFNCRFVQFFQVQLSYVSVCSSSIDLNFNLFRFNLYQCSNDFVRLTCFRIPR